MTEHHVLVMEDDRDLTRQWSKALEAAGLTVTVAHDAASALTHAVDHVYGLVITDCFIVEESGELSGSGGLTLIAQLRTPELSHVGDWGRTVPILAVTGASAAAGFDVLEYARSMGANRVLAKPIMPSELVRVAQDMIVSGR